MKAKIFCLLTILVIVGFAVSFFWNKENKKEISSSFSPEKPQDGFGKLINKTKFISQDPFEGWSVYKNATFSYQLRYPLEFTAKDQGKISEKNLNLTHFLLNKEGKQYPLIGITTLALPFEDFKKKILDDQVSFPNTSEISVAGSFGIRTFYTDKETRERKDEVYFPSKDKAYTSYRIFCFTEFEEESYLDVFEKMLSSFSFVE